MTHHSTSPPIRDFCCFTTTSRTPLDAPSPHATFRRYIDQVAVDGSSPGFEAKSCENDQHSARLYDGLYLEMAGGGRWEPSAVAIRDGPGHLQVKKRRDRPFAVRGSDGDRVKSSKVERIRSVGLQSILFVCLLYRACICGGVAGSISSCP